MSTFHFSSSSFSSPLFRPFVPSVFRNGYFIVESNSSVYTLSPNLYPCAFSFSLFLIFIIYPHSSVSVITSPPSPSFCPFLYLIYCCSFVLYAFLLFFLFPLLFFILPFLVILLFPVIPSLKRKNQYLPPPPPLSIFPITLLSNFPGPPSLCSSF